MAMKIKNTSQKPTNEEPISEKEKEALGQVSSSDKKIKKVNILKEVKEKTPQKELKHKEDVAPEDSIDEIDLKKVSVDNSDIPIEEKDDIVVKLDNVDKKEKKNSSTTKDQTIDTKKDYTQIPLEIKEEFKGFDSLFRSIKGIGEQLLGNDKAWKNSLVEDQVEIIINGLQEEIVNKVMESFFDDVDNSGKTLGFDEQTEVYFDVKEIKEIISILLEIDSNNKNEEFNEKMTKLFEIEKLESEILHSRNFSIPLFNTIAELTQSEKLSVLLKERIEKISSQDLYLEDVFAIK